MLNTMIITVSKHTRAAVRRAGVTARILNWLGSLSELFVFSTREFLAPAADASGGGEHQRESKKKKRRSATPRTDNI